MKRFVVAFGLLVHLVTHAALPQGCYAKGAKFEEDALLLQDKHAVYLLKNKNDHPIFIDVAEHEGGQAGWLIEVAVGKMSAIKLETGMAFHCFEKRPGSEMKIDCDYVLEPCKLSLAQLDKADKGSYWLVENEAYPQLVDKLKRKGVLKP